MFSMTNAILMVVCNAYILLFPLAERMNLLVITASAFPWKTDVISSRTVKTVRKNCITVSIDPNKYLTDKPPPALPGKDKSEVKVSVNLLDILSLAVVDMKITTKYEL